MEGAEKENQEAAEQKQKQRKLKSCKGCLYHSSLVNPESRRRDPICFGLTKTLQRVPAHIVREFETKASKEGGKVKDLKYTCVGYSVYLEAKDPPANPQDNQLELPLCSGIRLLVGKKVSSVDQDPAPVNSGEGGQHISEDGEVHPKPRPYKRPQPIEAGFLSRFTRNASVVASGVSRNMHRVGRYIKDNVDDMLYPYRRRPK